MLICEAVGVPMMAEHYCGKCGGKVPQECSEDCEISMQAQRVIDQLVLCPEGYRDIGLEHWWLAKSGKFDKIGCCLADRHYSRRKPGSPQFMPPGQTIVLIGKVPDAVWGWQRPHPSSGIKLMSGLDGWTCTIFRNESPVLSSEQTRRAEMNIEDLTLREIKEISRLVGNDNQSPYQPGTSWIWRCVTHYTVGEVDHMCGSSIVLKPGACWVADTGRYHEFLRDGWGAAKEVEPYPDTCTAVIERGAIVDAQSWPHGPCHEAIG